MPVRFYKKQFLKCDIANEATPVSFHKNLSEEAHKKALKRFGTPKNTINIQNK
jgi:hypothetical protein